jgi:hypothetical protein
VCLLPTERVAHFVQRNFGIKPLTIAMIGDIVFACSIIWRWFIPGVTVGIIGKIFDAALFFFIFWITIVVYPSEEDQIDRDASRGLSNVNKISPIQMTLRVFFLILLTINLLALASDTSLLNLNTVIQGSGLVIAMYFAACDPLPPGPSRFRKWIEGTFGKRALARN